MSGFSDWRYSARSGLAKTKTDGKKKFKGGNFFWRDRLKLEKEPVTLMFMPSEYPNFSSDGEKVLFYSWPKHTVTRGEDYFRTFACSSEGGKNDCVGCHLQYSLRDKGVVLRDVFHFSVVILEWFYRVPALGADKKPLLNKNGEVVYNLEQPLNNKQKIEWSSKFDKVFGKRAYLEMGKGHLSHILDIADQVGSTCHCGGNLQIATYCCGVCESTILDMDTTELDPKEVQALVSSAVRCGECGYTDLPTPKVVCDSCDTPSPVSLTEVALTLSKTGEGTSSAIVSKSIVPLSEFNVPIDNQPVAIFSGSKEKPVLWNENIEPLLVQYDFAAMFKSELDHDNQAEMCKVPNPFTAVSTARSRY